MTASFLLKWEKKSYSNWRCAVCFLKSEKYKIIKSTEEVFFCFSHSWREKRDIVLDLGQCINFTLSSQWTSGGRACSFQTPSELPAQCYRGGLWGEWGGALTRGRWTLACLSPAPSCFIWALRQMQNPQPLNVIGYEYPVKSGWWADVNILLMFRLLICSLTHHRRGQWQDSKRMKLSPWEPLTHRGGAGG